MTAWLQLLASPPVKYGPSVALGRAHGTMTVVDAVIAAFELAALFELAQEIDPEYVDDAGRIIGSPAPGPDPQHSGDRGGFAQLLTLAFLVSGVSFVAWRIQRAMVQAATPTSR